MRGMRKKAQHQRNDQISLVMEMWKHFLREVAFNKFSKSE